MSTIADIVEYVMENLSGYSEYKKQMFTSGATQISFTMDGSWWEVVIHNEGFKIDQWPSNPDRLHNMQAMQMKPVKTFGSPFTSSELDHMGEQIIGVIRPKAGPPKQILAMPFKPGVELSHSHYVIQTRSDPTKTWVDFSRPIPKANIWARSRGVYDMALGVNSQAEVRIVSVEDKNPGWFEWPDSEGLWLYSSSGYFCLMEVTQRPKAGITSGSAHEIFVTVSHTGMDFTRAESRGLFKKLEFELPYDIS